MAKSWQRGRPSKPAILVRPARACSCAALHWGEKLRYEFFYRPGEFHVHPCLGRLAFLLEPDGVRLHWLTSSGNEEWTGLAPNNAIDVPADRRGPGKLPLKPDDWNALRLAMNGDTLTIELNGQVVYERKLDADEERLFSLFHYQDRSAVRVRNVVLAGNWSKNLPGLEAVNIATKASSAESRAGETSSANRCLRRAPGCSAKVLRSRRPNAIGSLPIGRCPVASRSVFQLPGNFVPADDRRGGEAEGRLRRSPQGNEFQFLRSSSSKRLAKATSLMNWPTGSRRPSCARSRIRRAPPTIAVGGGPNCTSSRHRCRTAAPFAGGISCEAVARRGRRRAPAGIPGGRRGKRTARAANRGAGDPRCRDQQS